MGKCFLIFKHSLFYAERSKLCTLAHRLYCCVIQEQWRWGQHTLALTFPSNWSSPIWSASSCAVGAHMPNLKSWPFSPCTSEYLLGIPACSGHMWEQQCPCSSASSLSATKHWKSEDYPRAEKTFVVDISQRLLLATGKQMSLSNGFSEEDMGETC